MCVYDCTYMYVCTIMLLSLLFLASWEERTPLPECQHVAAAFQTAVCQHLLTRTHRAIVFCQRSRTPISHLAVSGGVASNSQLYRELCVLGARCGIAVLRPLPALCTDNAVMVAWAGLETLWVEPEAGLWGREAEALRFHPKWPLGVDVSQSVRDMDIKVKSSEHQLSE